jgi:hypothetical protein
MEFSEKDAADLAGIKKVIVSKALDGDTQAATAFANLLNAETERSKAITAPVQEATPAPIQEKAAALAAVPSTWTEAVSSGSKQADVVAQSGIAA